MSFTLYEMTSMYRNVSNLIEEDGDNEDLFIALDSITDNVRIKTENIAKLIKSVEGNMEVIREEEKRLAAKRRALGNKVESLKDYMENEMRGMNLDRVDGDLFTIAIQKNPPSVNFSDEDLIPEEFKEEVVTVKISKKEIAEAIKRGEEVPGAEMVQKESLRIR